MWRHGATVPSDNAHTRRALLGLERALGLTPGDLLLSLKGTWPPPAPGLRRRQPALEPDGATALLARLRHRDIGYEPAGRLVTEVADTYVIGDDRRPLRVETSLSIRAMAGEVSTYWCSYRSDGRAEVRAVPLDGCRLGRTVTGGTDPATGGRAVATELVLDTPLELGATSRLSFALENHYGSMDRRLPYPGWIRAVRDPGCRRLEMRIVFGTTPQRLEWRTGEIGGDPAVPGSSALMLLDQAGSASMTVSSPAIGHYGWTWRWPRADEALDPLRTRPDRNIGGGGRTASA